MEGRGVGREGWRKEKKKYRGEGCNTRIYCGGKVEEEVGRGKYSTVL